MFYKDNLSCFNEFSQETPAFMDWTIELSSKMMILPNLAKFNQMWIEILIANAQ